MIEYGFFNSIDGDRTYNADAFNEFFSGILSETGVYKKSGNGLKVTVGSGMNVFVTTGKARIKNQWITVKSSETVTLTGSDLTNNRYDAIVLRLDLSGRNITLTKIDGTPAAAPSKPSLVRNENTYDICLAYVYVPAASSSVTEANIEDTREDTDLCGFVKLQIDAINAGIKQYRKIVKTTTTTNNIKIGIPEYDAENDLLFANINGVMFVEGEDYTVSGTGSTAAINTNFSVQPSNAIEFRVIKSVIEVL